MTNSYDNESDLEDAAERTGDKAKDMAGDAKDGAKKMWDKASDAVERMIPGDSDGDGN